MLHSLKKYTKKFFNKFTISLSIAMITICSLFAMTKTYAYDYNDNTNQLVGNNIIDTLTYSNSLYYNSSNGVINMPTQISVNNNVITYNLNGSSFDTGYVNVFFTDNNNYNFTNNIFNIVVLVESTNLSGSVGSGSRNYYIEYGFGTSSDNTTQFGYSAQSNQAFWYQSGSHSFMYTYMINYINNSNYYGFKFRLGTSGNANFTLNGTIKVSFFLFNDKFNSNYFINNNQAFVAYSSVEQLQEDYNTLLQQYNDLQSEYADYQSNHYYTNNQYGELQRQISTLQGQLSQLQLQYDTYVASHSYTNEQYNQLNLQYQTLQNNYFTLLTSYNDLQNRFDEIVGESTNAMYFALNGATANLYTDVSGSKVLLASDTISINQSYMNFDNSCIPNINLYMLGYDSEDNSTYPNPYCYIEINLNMSVNSTLLFTFDNTILDTDITLSSTISNVTKVYNRHSDLNSYELVVNSDRNSFNTIVYDGIYMPDYISIDFSLQLDGYSYSVGYDKGVASQQSRINSLNSSVSSMQSSINALRGINQELQEAANNSMGWKNLFFAMADTPFKTVSNVLGFELFGLNLFTTFIGMITVFAIVWLLKKFI